MPTTKQKNLVKKWVAALRSGKYKQGKGVLRSEKGKYCCLGVLCDVASPKGWNKTPEKALNSRGKAFGHRLDDYSPDMIAWKEYFRLTGLDKLDPDTLVIMNDDDRKSFSTIANHIESVLENGDS